MLPCHYDTSSYIQLADEGSLPDGKKLMIHVAEDTFYDVITAYFRERQVIGITERFMLGEQYYAGIGFGQLRILQATPRYGEAELMHSHVDEQWVQRWGMRDKPVNYTTCGYLCALFAAVFERPTRAYTVTEVESIVSGAARSRFEIVIN